MGLSSWLERAAEKVFGDLVDEMNARAGSVSDSVDDGWKHFGYKTKIYETPEKVVSDLRGYLRENIPEHVDGLYWRLQPTMYWIDDFDLDLRGLLGRVRFSYKEKHA